MGVRSFEFVCAGGENTAVTNNVLRTKYHDKSQRPTEESARIQQQQDGNVHVLVFCFQQMQSFLLRKQGIIDTVLDGLVNV